MRGRGGRGRGPDRRWSITNAGNRAIHAERGQKLLAAQRRAVQGRAPGPPRALDLGCGAGDGHRELRALGLVGRVVVGADRARARLPVAQAAGLLAVVAEGGALPFRGASFDTVSTLTLFSSVPCPARSVVADEIARVLAPGGLVLWYDTRVANPWNAATAPVPRREIAGLFPGFAIDVGHATVVPQLARRLGPFTGVAYRWLSRAPWLTTHLVGVLQKP